ncbi:class I SAM-dependent methyltransferase [Gynuella sunshinyii]|uniref:Methylase involved in ubiquinone/menaquinone biosynthesis n=1 Tax=Gynuella sunshinyii YC6258 TaxID=1445510 RepID=A0A0C5VFQ0_9GAMM|nr:methyltransferase domain-containing protein [Gynuella sunshinyii]AJQ93402.1 methylase involved in ubiquinone/menaquinone biosynthesis [Gynuella sunshinyii YC6258]
MSAHSDHNDNVVSQFTRQAIPFTQLPGHMNAVELLVELAQVDADSQVLDVASGPGLVAAAFAAVAGHVECLDLTPAMLMQARNYAAEKRLSNMSFKQGNAMQLPYQDACFDVVVTRYSFHHFLEPEQVLAEMIRVCKPGGRVVVADVAIEPLVSERFNAIERLRDSSHVCALSSARLDQCFLQDVFVRCTKSRYTVDVELEQQLSASFPKPGDDITIRTLITQDIGLNQTGFNPRWVDGDVHYSYPISVYSGVKA